MLRKMIVLMIMAGAAACAGLLASSHLATALGGDEGNAEPRAGEAAAPVADDAKADAPKYTYTLNHRYCDSRHSRYLNSTPIAWPYIKWAGGNGAAAASNFVMDGEYAYQVISGSTDVTRYSLRTGKDSAVGDFGGKEGWTVIPNAGALQLENGTLYISGTRSAPGRPREGALYAISTADGKTRWVFTPENMSEVTKPLILPGGKILATAGRGNTDQHVCLDRATGNVLWQLEEEHQAGDKIVCGEHVILSNHSKTGWNIRAVDTTEGKPAWDALPNSRMIVLASDGQRVFCGVDQVAQGDKSSTGIIAYDGKTGKEIWRSPCGSRYAIAGDGRIVTTAPPTGKPDDPGQTIILDPATGETLAKLPPTGGPLQMLGEWAVTDRTVRDNARPPKIFTILETFNSKTGEIRTLMDGSALTAEYNPLTTSGSVYPATDGCILVRLAQKNGKLEYACLEDMRFHPDAVRLLFDFRPEMLDDKMRARIAELVEKTADSEPEPRNKVTEEILASFMDLAEEQCRAAEKDPKNGFQWEAMTNALRKIEEWKKLRQYLADLDCARDPIYFTALIRHSPDPAVQQKAIDRLKQITGQDFGLKPSAEWTRDQKEASDKYDAWWQENR